MKVEEYNKKLIIYLKKIAPMANGIYMSPCDVVFEECVKMNCYYCGKYGVNWKCPPNLPDIDFPKMFAEYEHGLFVIFEYHIVDQAQYEGVRNESSITLHKTLLALEKWLWNHNNSTAISFGAGSCKLCKGGCGKDRCNNPYMARSPLEATGVNIVKTAKKCNYSVA